MPSLEACVDLGAGAEALDCLDRGLAELPAGAAQLAALRDLVPELPAAVLELAARRADPPGAEPGAALRAGWLDLQGQALLELGRFDEAAARLTEALSIDDETLRFTWVSPERGEQWRVSLDTGGGRLERTARSLVSAGRPAEARAPLGRALALGAGGWAEEAWSVVGEGPPAGRSERPEPLMAKKWFKLVPDHEVDLADGGRFSFRKDGRGRVMVLSFWATWCLPCRRELPHIQALYEAERENGLVVLAINADEPMRTALPFAKELELTFPIASGNNAIYEAFDTSRLPVLAIVDRWGAVRGRWAGYEDGDEERLFSMTRRLLTEQGPPSRQVAEVLFGGDLFEIAWQRPAQASVEGLAVLPRNSEAAGLLVSAARSLALYGDEGQTLDSWVMPAPIGQLRASPAAEDGRVEVLGFRAGSSALVSIDLPSGDQRQWSSPSPVFDAALLGPPGPEDEADLLLATLTGVDLRSGGSEPLGAVETIRSGASGVLSPTGDSAGATAVLEFGGRVTWMDSELASPRHAQAPPESWVLMRGAGPAEEVGVAPAGVRAAVSGRFLDRPGSQAALATDSGQLVLVDLLTGETLFRARWDGISALAAGDLLGDDRDELVVASGTEFGVLIPRTVHPDQ